MLDTFTAENKLDENGNPAGGHVNGKGLNIQWQKKPLGRGAEKVEPTGAFIETVIAAVIQRIESYQKSKFVSKENSEAIGFLKSALTVLEARTARREAQGVKGTHGLDVIVKVEAPVPLAPELVGAAK